jgi:Major Facilitator Superfamily
VLMVVPLLLALTLDKSVNGWASPLILGLFALSLVGLALFILVELRAAGPIIPLKLFRNRSFTLINLASPMVGASMFAAVLFLSLYLVNVLDVSATAAGSSLIPLMGGMVTSSIVASQIVQRLGRYKLLVLGGMLVAAAGFWWLTTLNVDSTLNEVRERMVVIGVGLGAVMPILTLALQNAVPFEYIGAATAARQFFQQLGQVLGAAIFGAILTTTLTHAIEANLAPIKAKLPAEMAAQFDTSKLKNGSTSAEAAVGEQVPIEQRIADQIKARFEAQRTLITKAVRDNDQAAIQALLSSPQTPAEFKQMLQAGIPAAAREQALAKLNAGLDAAEANALVNGQQLGRELSAGIKNAFTDSVIQIYWYAIPLVLLAFVITLFMPELALRRSNSPAPTVAIE